MLHTVFIVIFFLACALLGPKLASETLIPCSSYCQSHPNTAIPDTVTPHAAHPDTPPACHIPVYSALNPCCHKKVHGEGTPNYWQATIQRRPCNAAKLLWQCSVVSFLDSLHHPNCSVQTVIRTTVGSLAADWEG